MKSLRNLILGRAGIVLAGTLMILTALVAAGIAARLMLRNDHRTTANLRHGSQAFYLAASGIEWAKSELLSFTGITPKPADRSVSFNNGRFSVFFVSELSVSPLSAQFVVRSLGVLNSDSHALQARLTKSYDLSDSALGLRGNIQMVQFSGTDVTISGVDHDPVSGQPTGITTARPAVSTDSQSTSDLVRAQTAGLPLGSLQSDSDTSPVASSNQLTAATLGQLADQLCAVPGAITLSIPVSGTLALVNQSWGSTATPQIHCVDGVSGPGDGVALSGDSSGAGILIVRNAELILNGAFRWDGLIIVTGSEVSLNAGASSNTNIFGAILLNETGDPAPGAAALDIEGSFRSAFSSSALNRAASLIPNSELGALHAILPSSIWQDYWRSVSP
ncbi:MAG TPA: hypothetical protein VF208_11225 [Candidatus Binatia bacterium]